MKENEPVIMVLAVVVSLLVIAGFFSSYPELQQNVFVSSGSVKTFGVSMWQDLNLTTLITFIDWGMLEPAENKTVSYYLRNDGNTPSNLSLRTENWQPTNTPNYINLSWNLEGASIEVAEALEADLTLTVSPNIENITTFSFDIILSGIG